MICHPLFFFFFFLPPSFPIPFLHLSLSLSLSQITDSGIVASVKNSEESKILLYSQLTQQPATIRTKGLFDWEKNTRARGPACAPVSAVPAPMEGGRCLYAQQVPVQKTRPEFRKSESFITGNKPACPLHCRRT